MSNKLQTSLFATEVGGTENRGISMPLGSRLGILVVVLSPQFGCDSARLAYFLEQVPPWIEVAVEFRHPSWHTEEVFPLLERSLCGLLRSGVGGTFGVSSSCMQRGHSSMYGSTTPTPTALVGRSHPGMGKSGATCVGLLQQRRSWKCSSQCF